MVDITCSLPTLRPTIGSSSKINCSPPAGASLERTCRFFSDLSLLSKSKLSFIYLVDQPIKTETTNLPVIEPFSFFLLTSLPLTFEGPAIVFSPATPFLSFSLSSSFPLYLELHHQAFKLQPKLTHSPNCNNSSFLFLYRWLTFVIPNRCIIIINAQYILLLLCISMFP